VRVALLSAIAWSIPIPTKSYSFIASVVTFGGANDPAAVSAVKNHTFF